MEHAALVGQPDVMFALAPELRGLALPVESRATCQTCVLMSQKPSEDRAPFMKQELRCCTFQPLLPNYLIGRGLQAGGSGAELLRAAIGGDFDRRPTSLGPTEAWLKQYRELGHGGFGRTPEMKCAFYVGGEHSCGIWQTRGAVCRTWHCRYVDAERGEVLWRAVRDLIRLVEHKLSQWLVAQGTPPTPSDSAESWADWYLRCAERLDATPVDELVAKKMAGIEELRAQLRSVHEQLASPRPMPDQVSPAVGAVTVLDCGDVLMSGYSFRDFERLDRGIFAFLAALDGSRPWRPVLAEVNATLETPVPEEAIERLWWLGAFADAS